MKNILLILLIFFLGGNNKLQNYYFENIELSQNLPESIIDTSANFNIKIERDIKFKHLKEIIDKAESCYPPLENVNILFEATNKDTLKRNIWWYKKIGGVKIPYAITNSSIYYYHNLIKRYKKYGTLIMKQASFKYTAKVEYYSSMIYEEKEYENVYVVELKMSWYHVCGRLCGLYFSKNRLVIFSKDELKLLGVIGDGRTSYGVS